MEDRLARPKLPPSVGLDARVPGSRHFHISRVGLLTILNESACLGGRASPRDQTSPENRAREDARPPWARLQFYTRIVFVCRAHAAQLVKGFRKQLIEKFQPLNILDHSDDLKVKLVHAPREAPAPKSSIKVLHRESDGGLSADQFPDFAVGEQLTQLLLVVALNDECLVKLGIAHVYVLHAKPLADAAENPFPVNGKGEAIRVNIGRAHPGVGYRGFACRNRVGIQRYRPFSVPCFHLAALPKAALNQAGAGLGAELSPDFLFARAKPCP